MRNKIFPIVLAFVFLQLTGFAHGAIPASERAALIALYNSTDGDNWLYNSGWKAQPLHTDGFAMPGTEGSWHGIILSGDSVWRIDLSYNRLTGSIPSQLGNLSNLANLSFDHNQLSGSIPTQIGNLSQLKFLNLGGNSLSGSIPSQLGNLSNLTYLNLWANQLSGCIPPQLGNLNQLWLLNLSSNPLSGNIPPQLGNLINLKELGLYGDGLSGSIPSQLGKLSQLSILGLGYNYLSGSIPPELGNLVNLDWFSMEQNQLSGSIPSQFGKLTKLSCLNLGFNQLSGDIPYQFGNMTNLFYLDLSNNDLSGGIPSQFGNLSNLEIFRLDRNILTGIIPTSLTSLKKITNFDIGYNCLSATDPILRVWLNTYDSDWETTQCFTVPIVTTNSISSITSTSAICGGNVVSDGRTPITDRGVCWDTDINPMIGDSRTVDGTGIGSYTSTITGLVANTKYYVRAYAANIIGTAYGSTEIFTTSSNLPEIDPPFGSFDTPLDGSTVAGSIAITGWALDDGGVESIKIYLQGDTQTYIGDALLVEGARPDVASTYPEYPGNTKAGWGYMMLTNFLPDGGNGTFVLSAIATDLVGKKTILGSKTIIVDNAHAVKPFGAIDTPTQGGTAMGSSFVNWGWVLTPQPNDISANGSTISVWVNSVPKGHPEYNIYRSDIATLFPGYANSSGAAGYFYLDTTKYTDEVNTIFWIASDNSGNSDGIGCRYFIIQNSPSDSTQGITTSAIKMNLKQISALPGGFSVPIMFSKGFNAVNEYKELPMDENGNSGVVIKELDRVEIQLGGENYVDIQGYIISSNKLNRLPIGSTLNSKSRTFSWSPGPGFLGRYFFVFVLTNSNGQSFKKSIEIEVEPKFNGAQ